MAQIRTDGLYQGDLITFIDNALTLMTEFKTDFNAALTKIDNDGTVVATNFNSTWAISATVLTRSAAIRKDGIFQGDLFTLLSNMATFSAACKTAMNGLLAKLDADPTVNLTTYASGFTTASATPSVASMSATGMGKAMVIDFLIACSNFFTELKTDYNACLAQLDTDTGVADTNAAATNPVSGSLSTTV